MNTDQLVGDVVADWLKHGGRRRTVAFAVDVAHSVHIRNAFLEFDVRAEHLDGSTPKTSLFYVELGAKRTAGSKIAVTASRAV